MLVHCDLYVLLHLLWNGFKKANFTFQHNDVSRLSTNFLSFVLSFFFDFLVYSFALLKNESYFESSKMDLKSHKKKRVLFIKYFEPCLYLN